MRAPGIVVPVRDRADRLSPTIAPERGKRFVSRISDIRAGAPSAPLGAALTKRLLGYPSGRSGFNALAILHDDLFGSNFDLGLRPMSQTSTFWPPVLLPDRIGSLANGLLALVQHK
jgi:hypothetical protein